MNNTTARELLLLLSIVKIGKCFFKKSIFAAVVKVGATRNHNILYHKLKIIA